MIPWLDKPSIKLLVGAISVFAPIKAAILTVLLLVICDLVLGIMAAKKRKEKITSSGLRRTVTKLFVYESAIMLGFLTQKYLMNDMFPICNIINSFIGLAEMKSLVENLSVLSGHNVFKGLIVKLNNENKKDKMPGQGE